VIATISVLVVIFAVLNITRGETLKHREPYIGSPIGRSGRRAGKTNAICIVDMGGFHLGR
jgi:hypothetical protein